MSFKFIIVSAFIILLSAPLMAQSPEETTTLSCEESQKLGEEDAMKADAPEWTFYGIAGGILPVAMASGGQFLPPSIPENVNRECYKYGYMKTAQKQRAKSAMNGCLVTTFATIGIGILFVVNTMD